jgi:hypothetical protein
VLKLYLDLITTRFNPPTDKSKFKRNAWRA